MSAPSLRLRPLVSLLLFLSAYSPLMVILVIKDMDASHPWLLGKPVFSGLLIVLAVASSLVTLRAVRDIGAGLPVVVTKAANRSGDMFGYSVPYIVSFIRMDEGDWQTLASLLILLAVLFTMAYRTQTVFINPILAIAGYMLIDCTFKRGETITQAMVITRRPIGVGDTCRLERLSYYLYIAAPPAPGQTENQDGH
ncbi:hypothetical protein [Bordetella petrii]|uniref:hypothetical protein n=1 Tax=Bordetella petrii TaxID=94624 RepID=UPI001E551252|nr:hypothetical protein [Bordetella petrii]MCD0501530.1 hypothetical protein [Bordetella petrii]